MLVSKFVSRVKSALESFPLNSRVVCNTPYSGGEFPPRLKLKNKGLVILFIVMPFQETSRRNKEIKKKKTENNACSRPWPSSDFIKLASDLILHWLDLFPIIAQSITPPSFSHSSL